MPSIYEVYGSGTLMRAADLQGEVTYTISAVRVAKTAADDKEKIILSFQETDKELALNKTNAQKIAEIYGEDYTQWTGKKITLYKTLTTFRGQEVSCIRVKAPAAQQ